MTSIYKIEPSTLREDILRILVFKGERTPTALAKKLEVNRDDVIAELVALKNDGTVSSRGDIGSCICRNCDTEYSVADPGDSCDIPRCGGYLRDDSYWRLAAPISEALKVA